MALELWALFSCTAFFAFLTSTVFGIGSALILGPVMMVAFPAAEAVAMMAPIMVLNNILKAGVFRSHIDFKNAGLALLSAFPLAALGAYCVNLVDDKMIVVGIACIILAALMAQRLLPRLQKISARGLFVLGGLSGFLSGLCGVGGPTAAIGFKGVGLVKERFVGTIALFAIGMQIAKIPMYLASNTLRTEHAFLVCALSLIAIVSVFIGRKIVTRFEPDRYRVAIDVVLLLVALTLLTKSIIFS